MANEPGRTSLEEKYVAKQDNVIVLRAIGSEFIQNVSSHLESVIIEFSRAFGFRMDKSVARQRVVSVLKTEV